MYLHETCLFCSAGQGCCRSKPAAPRVRAHHASYLAGACAGSGPEPAGARGAGGASGGRCRQATRRKASSSPSATPVSSSPYDAASVRPAASPSSRISCAASVRFRPAYCLCRHLSLSYPYPGAERWRAGLLGSQPAPLNMRLLQAGSLRRRISASPRPGRHQPAASRAAARPSRGARCPPGQPGGPGPGDKREAGARSPVKPPDSCTCPYPVTGARPRARAWKVNTRCRTAPSPSGSTRASPSTPPSAGSTSLTVMRRCTTCAE